MEEVHVYSAMQTGEPKKIYIKSQLGKVVVKALNPFNDEPIEVILQGNPRLFEDSSMIELWNDKQIAYFERMNSGLIESGWIAEITKDVIKEREKLGELSAYTKKDKIELFERSYMGFRSFVNKVTSIDFLNDLMEVANEIEASEAFKKVITGRIETLAMAKSLSDVEPVEEYSKDVEVKKEKRKRGKKS